MSTALHILVVEDDRKIAQLVCDYLHEEGYTAQQVHDGTLAWASFRHRTPDLVILDLMLPGMDGLVLCQEMRACSDVPIILLTARVDEVDRLLGLNTGADDYVCKPFSPRELMARVRNLLRRSRGAFQPAQAWRIDPAGQRIYWRAQELDLTPVEFRLFQRLLTHPGRVFSRSHLLDAIHDGLHDTSDRVIDSHIKNLRKKIWQVAPQDDCIASVYGMGYRFNVPELAEKLPP
jgi:two-component system response regulator BaeR